MSATWAASAWSSGLSLPCITLTLVASVVQETQSLPSPSHSIYFVYPRSEAESEESFGEEEEEGSGSDLESDIDNSELEVCRWRIRDANKVPALQTGAHTAFSS